MQALERRGFAYRSAKKFDEAVEDYTKLIKKSPKDAEAYRRRGVAYSEGGKHKEADEDFEEVLKLKPNDEDATTRLKTPQSKGRWSRPRQQHLRPAETTPDFNALSRDSAARGGNFFDTRRRTASLPTLFAGTKRSHGRSNCEV